MRRLGIVGGVSPEATAIYYRLLNEEAQARLGPRHSIDAVFRMLDYGAMIALYDAADWTGFAAVVAEAASDLKRAGAEAIVISSNTSHVGADAAAQATGLPVVHILDALVEALREKGVRRPLLLGTPAVMAEGLYRSAFAARFGADAMVPDLWAQNAVGRIILDELVRGRIEARSRDELVALVDRASAYGADGVILGCTELCMILAQDDVEVPLFDTTRLHVAAAARFAFDEWTPRETAD